MKRILFCCLLLAAFCCNVYAKEVTVIFLAGVDDMEESFYLLHDDEDMIGKTLYWNTDETTSLVTSVSLSGASVAHINSSEVDFFERDGNIVFYYVLTANVADDADYLYLAIVTDTQCQTGQYVLDLETETAYKDADGDGLTDYVEVTETGTDPSEADSDFDGFTDGEEVADADMDPFTPNSSSDTDGDGLLDAFEISIGTNPLLADTDGNGTNDLTQYAQERMSDTDGDGIIDVADPNDDNDEFSDAEEIIAGTNVKFSAKMAYVAYLYTTEDDSPVFVGLTTNSASKHPVVKIKNRTAGTTREFECGYDNYWAKGIVAHGNLDGQNGIEVEIWMRNRDTGEDLFEIRDIQTGELYVNSDSDSDNDSTTSDAETDGTSDDGSTDETVTDETSDDGSSSGTTGTEETTEEETAEETTDEESDTETLGTLKIKFIAHEYFDENSKVVFIGFCEETQRTMTRIMNTNDRSIISETIYLDEGEHALGVKVYDINDDGTEDIVVVPITEKAKEVGTVTGLKITIE